MQTVRIVQAVALMMIVALAASCAASKEYTTKLFSPRTPVVKDSQATALRFLNIDTAQSDQEGWVTTDIIMGRDTITNTAALDKLSNTIKVPSSADSTVKKDTILNTNPSILVSKPSVPVITEPVARAMNPGEVRTKRSRDK